MNARDDLQRLERLKKSSIEAYYYYFQALELFNKIASKYNGADHSKAHGGKPSCTSSASHDDPVISFSMCARKSQEYSLIVVKTENERHLLMK